MRKKPKKRSPRRRPADSTLGARKMYTLRLYITGQTPRSVASVRNLRHVCDEYLTGRFELQVIDIYQQPELARDAEIIAAPTPAELDALRRFQARDQGATDDHR